MGIFYSPLGSCNFSRLDSIVLNITIDDSTYEQGSSVVCPRNNRNIVYMYAIYYNITRIMYVRLAYNNYYIYNN
jgi:hypothetical protein